MGEAPRLLRCHFPETISRSRGVWKTIYSVGLISRTTFITRLPGMPGVVSSEVDSGVRVVVVPAQSSYFAGEPFSVTITFTNTRSVEAGPSRTTSFSHKRGAHSISSAPLARPPTSPGTPRASPVLPSRANSVQDTRVRKGLIGKKPASQGHLPELIEQRRKKQLAKSLSVSISPLELEEQVGEGTLATSPSFTRRPFVETRQSELTLPLSNYRLADFRLNSPNVSPCTLSSRSDEWTSPIFRSPTRSETVRSRWTFLSRRSIPYNLRAAIALQPHILGFDILTCTRSHRRITGIALSINTHHFVPYNRDAIDVNNAHPIKSKHRLRLPPTSPFPPTSPDRPRPPPKLPPWTTPKSTTHRILILIHIPASQLRAHPILLRPAQRDTLPHRRPRRARHARASAHVQCRSLGAAQTIRRRRGQHGHHVVPPTTNHHAENAPAARA